jgi:hypothetical protein
LAVGFTSNGYRCQNHLLTKLTTPIGPHFSLQKCCTYSTHFFRI